MHAPFEYAVVRVVPDVAREEFVNVGVLYFCDARDRLCVRIELDEARLLALSPAVDLELVRRHLEALATVCAGGAEAGPIGKLSTRERWRWLVAPRSTILQMSAPHAGVGGDPERDVERILARVVRAPAPPQ